MYVWCDSGHSREIWPTKKLGRVTPFSLLPYTHIYDYLFGVLITLPSSKLMIHVYE